MPFFMIKTFENMTLLNWFKKNLFRFFGKLGIILCSIYATYVVYTKTSPWTALKINRFSKWKQSTSSPLQCAETINFDNSTKRNENQQEIKECKRFNGSFELSFEKNAQYVENYTFNVSKAKLKELDLDEAGIKKLSSQKSSGAKIPTFVTAFSDNHFDEFIAVANKLNKLKRTKYPELTLIVYDIGLTKDRVSKVQRMCNCSVRRFPFELYPEHVRNLRGYTWKPIIIQIMLQESDFVMWLDTSIRLKNMEPYFEKAQRLGFQVLYGDGSIAMRTQKRLFEHLHEEPCLFNYEETQTGVVIVSRSCFTLKYIMRPWVACALEFGCMDFTNSKNYLQCVYKWNLSVCHRFEQSTLGIITTRLFNNKRHQFILGYDFTDVCRGCIERFQEH